MRREIKFRGKRIDSGEWVYGDLGQSTDGYCRIYPASNKVQEGFPVVPETVGQYAGIKDDIETELYEGDIITNIDDIFVLPDLIGIYYMINECILFDGDFEIIGNVFDNPELLQEK